MVMSAARDADWPTTPGIGSNRLRTGDDSSQPTTSVVRVERVPSPQSGRRLATSTLPEMDNREGFIRHSKRTLPKLRLAPFDGSKPLERFLRSSTIVSITTTGPSANDCVTCG